MLDWSDLQRAGSGDEVTRRVVRVRRRVLTAHGGGIILCVVVAAGLALGLAATGVALPRASTAVAATLVDFKIKLSRNIAPPGAVQFRVTNKGSLGHDLVFVGVRNARTRILERGQRQTISVRFSKPGVYRFYCSIPGHRALGMAGSIRIGKGAAPPTAKPVAPPTTSTKDAQLTTIASGLGAITDVTAPPGDTARLLVAQQSGLVTLVKDGVSQSKPFLDLRDRTHAAGEQGLLSIAFAPDYGTSGLLYADFNDRAGNLDVIELRRSADDPDTVNPEGREVLRVAKPTADHNGGMLQFGPDGYLYISVGDGGADPPRVPVGAYGQTTDDLLGSILRIDPRHGDPYAIPPGNPLFSTAGARPEIVAYGLRNPWRFWIDDVTKQMLIGDVGEGTREEIDRLSLDQLGRNYGWPCLEGTTVTPVEITKPASCATAELTPPIYEYAHSDTRCSITGGVVSRDPRLPRLNGLYLWSDLCDGKLYTIDPAATDISAKSTGLVAPEPTVFGVDALDRVYVGTATGTVYRLDPATP